VYRSCRPLHSTLASLMTDKGMSAAEKPTANLNCRNAKYPRSNIDRFHVPDDKVDWAVDWPDYDPQTFTSPAAIGKPWSDPEHRYVLLLNVYFLHQEPTSKSLLILFFLLEQPLQKTRKLHCFKSMKFGRIVLQVNTHKLTESDFQFNITLSTWQSRHYFTQ